jgi:hypothetical protein
LLADLPALLLEPLLALLEPPFEAVLAEGISVLPNGVNRLTVPRWNVRMRYARR